MIYEGLTSKLAAAKLERMGPNTITEPGKLTAFQILFNQFKSPLIYVLLIAAFFSIALVEYTDAGFILLVVMINAGLGFFQEYRAENILFALQKKVSKTVKVIRDGKHKSVPVVDLVAQDLIVIESGLKIPADCTLLEASEISVNEAILTGESSPVHKKALRKEKYGEVGDVYQVFTGTSVLEGYGVARVEKTGDDTKFGKIAASLESKFDPPTPIKMELARIGKALAIVVVFITIMILLLGLSRGIEFEEIFLTSVALGVSTIPEGLIIALTVTLALGMNRIMSKGSVVRNLPAAETLGAVDILCIDKTGTLTLGNMQVIDTHFTDSKLGYQALAVSNNGTNYIDDAIIEYLQKNTKPGYLETHQDKRKQFFPFSSLRKYTGARDSRNLYAVGAPEKILKFSRKTGREWKKEITDRAKLGNRMVAVAYKPFKLKREATRDDFKDMKFLGLVFVRDPVRSTAEESLDKIIDSGIEVKVITGDLKETSMNVLQTLNFKVKDEEIISGKGLHELKGSARFDKSVAKTKLFYRTTPDQKLDIVLSLQRSGNQVGMMGDGVNDAPAVKKAEIGISVDSATDVTKEVADLILLDSNFQTVVDAVEQGRNIFQNLRKTMVYLFADSLSETVLIFASLLAGLPLPLLPLQLLWINIIEDGLPSLALSFDPPEKDLLKDRPRSKKDSIFDKKVITAIIIISLIIDGIYFILYKHMVDAHYDLGAARTVIYAGVSLSSLLFLFSAKTVDSNIWNRPIFNNKILNISLLIGIGLLMLSIYSEPFQQLFGTVPLNTAEVALIIFLAVLDLALTEIIKLGSRLIWNE